MALQTYSQNEIHSYVGVRCSKYCSVYPNPLFRANAPNPQLSIKYCPPTAVSTHTMGCFAQASTPFRGIIPSTNNWQLKGYKGPIPLLQFGTAPKSLSELFKLHTAGVDCSLTAGQQHPFRVMDSGNKPLWALKEGLGVL